MNRINGDMYVEGTLQAKSNIPSAASVGNSQVKPDANVAHTKNQHRHPICYGQNGNAANATVALYRASAGGQMLSVFAGSITKAVGDSTVTVDVKKNGVSILTGVITLDSGNTNRVGEAGTVDGSLGEFVSGDLFEIVIVATAGTGTLPTGLFVTIHAVENGL